MHEVEVEQVSLVLGEHYLISFQEDDSDVFDVVRTRLRAGAGRLRKSGPDYLAYTLIDAVVDNYFAILEQVGEEVEEIEDEVATRSGQETLREITDLAQTAQRQPTIQTPLPPTLAGRVPENAMLSHDLFEGLYARTALVTDVEFFEEFPAHEGISLTRLHRWTRGDWQLLPWMIGAAGEKPLPIISQWKMIDNLRRSLVPPTTFVGLIQNST